ncbi:hypothetical protein KUCAC02_020793, partial [Chaenocephalus aceratus]
KLSSSVPSAPTTAPVSHPCPPHPQCWRTGAAFLGMCAAPILITLGWSVCVWLFCSFSASLLCTKFLRSPAGTQTGRAPVGIRQG